jgi:hypothetical protein
MNYNFFFFFNHIPVNRNYRSYNFEVTLTREIYVTFYHQIKCTY